jgi:hypothetical protein
MIGIQTLRPISDLSFSDASQTAAHIPSPSLSGSAFRPRPFPSSGAAHQGRPDGTKRAHGVPEAANELGRRNGPERVNELLGKLGRLRHPRRSGQPDHGPDVKPAQTRQLSVVATDHYLR